MEQRLDCIWSAKSTIALLWDRRVVVKGARGLDDIELLISLRSLGNKDKFILLADLNDQSLASVEGKRLDEEGMKMAPRKNFGQMSRKVRYQTRFHWHEIVFNLLARLLAITTPRFPTLGTHLDHHVEEMLKSEVGNNEAFCASHLKR